MSTEERRHSKRHIDIIIDLDLTESSFPVCVITDIHLARFTEDYSKGLSDFLYQLKGVISRDQIKTVLILGDLFQRSEERKITEYIVLLQELDKLGTTIHVMPGNHDRRYVHELPKLWTGKFVNFHFTYIMHFDRFYFAHDMGHAGVGKSVISYNKWFATIRERSPVPIPPGAQVFLGHLHAKHESSDGLTITIAPFSPDIKSYAYVVISRDDSGSMSHDYRVLWI